MTNKVLLFLALVTLVLKLNAGVTYHVDKFVIANGGGKSVSSQFTVNGSIGQPDASQPLIGTLFKLKGGFWHDTKTINTDIIFKNGFE